jgi:ornithine cyclodeaminase/alanine dehydrogenase
MKTVKLYDPVHEQAERYIEAMKDICPNVEFVVCPDVRKACEDADVVTTCAPILEKPNRIITADMLKKDVFCMTSDYDSTFDAEVVNKGSAFVCDNRNQYLWTQEHGVYFQNGYPLADEIYADMGEVVAGKAEPVRKGRRTCLFMGIASHDVMTAKLILEKAVAKNVGTMLKL